MESLSSPVYHQDSVHSSQPMITQLGLVNQTKRNDLSVTKTVGKGVDWVGEGEMSERVVLKVTRMHYIHSEIFKEEN